MVALHGTSDGTTTYLRRHRLRFRGQAPSSQPADEKEAYKISMELWERCELHYVIKEKVSPVVYVTEIDGEVKRVHAVNMKPF
jgi:hypothetical protein